MKEKEIHKSIVALVHFFAGVMLVDIGMNWILERKFYMYAAMILLAGLLLSQVFIHYRKYESATLTTTFTFYIVAFFHVITLNNYVTCYFILLVVPIVTAVLLSDLRIKLALLSLSVTLFFVCNYLAGLKLYDNYLLLYGLFPCICKK